MNGPLQERTIVLDLDLIRATSFPDDYDTDLESEWSRYSNVNVYYQKQLANQIENQVNKILSILTSVLLIHRNLGQYFQINQSEIFMSFDVQSSSLNKQIFQTENAQIRLPLNFTNNKKLWLRVSLLKN